jgi:hypothetical protein
MGLVETGVDGSSRSVDVLAIDRPGDLGDIADLGLTRASSLWLSSNRQSSQSKAGTTAADMSLLRSCVPGQGLPPPPDRYRVRPGRAPAPPLPLRRLRRGGGGWPSHCRSTPELDQVRAHLATLVPYRIAAGVLEHFLPVEAGITHETLRGCTLKLGEEVRDAAAVQPAVAASAITVSVDSTYIRSCEDGQRHLELGNVETVNGARQVFAAVARTDTAIETLIRRGLKEVGQTPETELTAFTDGCSGLRSILVNAGITKPPYLDWFHIAMRLQHAEKTASNLPADTAEREHARAVIVAEVLRWRIWNGKDAKVTIERIRAVMPVFQGEQSGRKRDPSSRRLWTALREIDRYLTRQSAWLVNDAERHRAGWHVDHRRYG